MIELNHEDKIISLLKETTIIAFYKEMVDKWEYDFRGLLTLGTNEEFIKKDEMLL